MKLTFITTMAGHAWGGSEELWVNMATKAIEQGHKVYCSVFFWGQLPVKLNELSHKGAIIIKRNRFQYQQLYLKPWGKFVEKIFSFQQLKQIEKKSKADELVISMGGFCDLEVNTYVKYLLYSHKPFDLIIHVNPENYYPKFAKVPAMVEVCKKARTVYFVSNRLKEIAIRQTGYHFPNSELIINPVNMNETGILPWPDDTILQMACVGRLEASVKGHPILIQVLAQPQWQNRAWHLNIYGTGPDEDYFRYLVNAFGINDKVTFHGFTNDIRYEIWAKNHILLMPSYYEGLPIALVEAMLCGRTAVVTDVGGNIEILGDNKVGFIANGVNLGSFSTAMENMWQKKSELKEKGLQAFEAANKFISLTNETKSSH